MSKNSHEDILYIDNLLKNTLNLDKSKAKDVVEQEINVLEKKRKEAELKSYEKDIDSRQKLSNYLVWISIIWLIFCGTIITLIGLEIIKFSEKIVITFIIGSLAEVFGLWKISLNYFFGRDIK